MDFGNALNYPLKDKNWLVKVLIGAFLTLLSTIPFLGLFVCFVMYGYLLRVVKMVTDGIEDQLPEWNDWGGDFMRGLAASLGSLLYFIPMLPFMCCMWLNGALFSNDQGDLNFIGASIMCCLGSFMFLYSLVAMPVMLAAAARYANTGNWGDAFLNFGQRFREVRTHIGDTITFVVLGFIIMVVVGFLSGLTIWLCGVGLLFAWGGYLIVAYLVAQYGLALSEGLFKAKNSYI